MAKIVMLGGLATFLAKIKEIFQPLFGIVSVGGGVGTVELSPNKMTVVGTLTSALNVTLGSASGAGVQEYALRFTMGATAYSVTFPTGVKFPKDFSTSGYFEKGYTYEVDIIDGRAVIQKWANTINVQPSIIIANKENFLWTVPSIDITVTADEPWSVSIENWPGGTAPTISETSGSAGTNVITISGGSSASSGSNTRLKFSLSSTIKTITIPIKFYD